MVSTYDDLKYGGQRRTNAMIGIWQFSSELAKGSMLSSSKATAILKHEGFGIEKASDELLSKVPSKRNLTIAQEGSDELRYLNYQNAEGVAQGQFNTDILLRPNPSKVAVLEEFLHGTQNKLGIIKGTGTTNFAEWHVNDFMIRHSRLLGIGAADVELLKIQRQSYFNLLKK